MILRTTLIAAMVAGCTATGDEVRPPVDQIFFPSGLALTPAPVAGDPEPAMFVISSNSELRYDTGTVTSIDLAAVDALIAEWLPDLAAPPAGCTVDLRIPTAIVCDESPLLIPGAAVRTGNFATDLGVQVLASGGLRLAMPVRGDPSITWIDASADGRTLDCGGGGDIPICDDAHRLSQLRNDLVLPPLSPEPFSLWVDGANGYAVVTHLINGVITLLDMPTDGAAPVLQDALAGLFAANQLGQRSSIGAAGRTPGSPDDLVYVTSSTEKRVHMLYIRKDAGGRAVGMVPSEYFFLDRVFPSEDGRGITFGEGGDRAYIVNRLPPTLQIVDTSLDATGFPRNQVIGAIELCRDASVVQAGDLGQGERLYVSCFSDGEVWVLDPADGSVKAIVDVGRGPHKSALSLARRRLYVANFLEDTISVIDLTPGAPTENRMVLKIGTEREETE